MQVDTSFERPVGAAADVAELEYISALAQTDPSVRTDASLTDSDISLFLASRYGIKMSADEVRETVLQGLKTTTTTATTTTTTTTTKRSATAENDDDDDNNCLGRDNNLDLMEIVSILFIPVLLKAVADADSSSINEDIIPENLQLPPPEMLPSVLCMMLEDTTGDSSPKPLTPALIKQMLRSYGEIELSEDEQLLQDMVEAAQPRSSKDIEWASSLLNGSAFATALTHDVQSYEIDKETSMTTRFSDVFSSSTNDNDDKGNKDDDDDDKDDEVEEEKQEQKVTEKSDLNRVYTCPSIDTTVGSYRSQHLMIALWVNALFSYFAYFFSFSNNVYGRDCEEQFEYSLSNAWQKNAQAFPCKVGVYIFTWVFFFVAISFYGLVLVGFGSIGNYVGCKRWYLPIVGLCFVFFIAMWPFLWTDRFTKGRYLSIVAFSIAMLTCAFHFSGALGILLPSSWLDKCGRLKRWLSGSAPRAEMQIKSAAARKTNLMAKNALDMNRKTQSGELMVSSSNYHRAMTNYSDGNLEYEKVGGFFWVWKHLCNWTIYDEEGIWYSVRLLAANVSQYVCAAFLIYLGSVLSQGVQQAFDSNATASQRGAKLLSFLVDSTVTEERANQLVQTIAGIIAAFANGLINFLLQFEGVVINFNCTQTADQLDTFCDSSSLYDCDPNITLETLLCGLTNSTLDSFTQLALLNASGLDANGLINATKENIQQAIDSSVNSLYPAEKYMVTVPVIFGMAVAFCFSLSLAVCYLPSITSTILKARCGVIKTLHDKNFNDYRNGQDFVAYITGSLFWGNLFASLLAGGAVGLILFFFLWQATAYLAMILIATLIGIVVATVARYIIVLTCRCAFWQAFYRKKPASANVTLLGLEWSNFALSALFILTRLCKFMAAAAMSVGRIDYPLLTKEASKLGPMRLDYYPDIHLMDLLSHEAHRHPYIEILGTMYLLKIRHGPNFGTRAGSCWRLLFVYALMPWLHRYRALTRPEALEANKQEPELFDETETTEGASHNGFEESDGVGHMYSSIEVGPDDEVNDDEVSGELLRSRNLPVGPKYSSIEVGPEV